MSKLVDKGHKIYIHSEYIKILNLKRSVLRQLNKCLVPIASQ